MRLRDCVADAAFFINLSEEYALLDSGATEFGESDDIIDFLARCGNRVIGEIAGVYLPLRKKEEVQTNIDGVVGFDSFSKNPVHFLSAIKDGKRVSFKEFPDRLETDQTGKIIFDYAYLPDKIGLDEDIPFRNGKLDSRIIGYGIAAEYYLINGQSDEAIVWDKRYRDGLHSSQLCRREMRVRKRCWA